MASVLPQAHTAYTKESGELGSGLMMAKGARGMSSSTTDRVEVQMGSPVTGPDGKSRIQILAQTTKATELSPGVAGLPYMMHSLDSFIMHLAMKGTESLNVHDEKANGFARVEETAKAINGSTWQAMLNYSPATEAYEMLERAIVNALEMHQKGNVSDDALYELQAVAQGMLTDEEVEQNRDGKNLFRVVLAKAKAQEYEANRIRLSTLAVMGVIDQYTWEGGEYRVSKDDRAEAAAMLAKLKNAPTEKSLKAAQKLGEAMTALNQEEETKPVKLEADGTDKTSVFGTLGKSTGKSDPEWVAFFKENPKATAGQVMRQLYRKLNGSMNRTDLFNLQLLRLLNKTVSHDMEVMYITADTQRSEVKSLPKGPSFAWYTNNVNTNEEFIYVMGTEFKDSYVTTETLLHELTHGALARTVARELEVKKANPKYKSETLDLINELEELRADASFYAQDNGMLLMYGAALDDIQEFIAWGMNNQAFQRDIINKVSRVSSTDKNSFVKGMQVFVSKLVGILFKGSPKTEQEQAVNGMTVLVTNVSALFSVAASQLSDDRAAVPPLNLSMAAALYTYSMIDIHNALNAGDVTPEFDLNLRNILSGIVDKLHGPFGSFKESLMKDQALSPMDVWLKAINTGVAPFASSVLISPLKVSEREAHAMEQVEAVMTAVLGRTENTTSSAYKELSKLYAEMRDTLTPADFANQDEYDFIFGVTLGANGQSDHLARFAAFGLAHQEFNKLMQRSTAVTVKSSLSGKPFAERLQIIWENVLEYFVGQVTKTFTGQAADDKLKTLVSQLVDIEAKKRSLIEARAKGMNPMATVEQGLQSAGLFARDQLSKVAGSKFVQQNRSSAVRAAGSLARIYVNDQVEGLMNTLVEYRDKSSKEKHGVVMGLLTDARGPGKAMNALALASTNNQRLRKSAITDTSRIVMDAFIEGGKNLDAAAKSGMTQLLLRSGLHNLLGTLTMGDLENVLGNKPALDAEIAALEAQLTGPFKAHFIHMANALGYFKMTGKVGHRVMMMNAHNIARLYGTVHTKRMTEADAQVFEPIIEKLVALYAVGYADAASVSAVRGVLATENARTDGGNGVEFVLALHKTLEKESKARLFSRQGALAMHGYTPEIMNPHTQVRTANEIEGKELVLQGYKQGGRVATDPADPDKSIKHVYVLKDGGLMPFLTGVISYTGKNAKGTKQHSGYMNPNTADGLANASLQADIMHNKPTTLAAGPRPDLSKSNQSFMAPVVNPQGQIVNWRYLMQDTTKNALLDRDNRFEKVLGTHAGSIFDKESTSSHNKMAIAALKEIHNDQKGTNAESFVLVGPKSPDAELREIWSMLPDDTKAAARSVWGKDGMWVRKDQLTIMFGYRKQSLAEAFRKDPRARGHLEELFVVVMENTLAQYKKFKEPGISEADATEYAKRAAVLVTRGERAWQELVYETKDILVVKTGVVMLGNIWSNLSLLVMTGVPLVDVVKHHLTAYRGYRQYHADSERIADLTAQLDTGLTRGNDAQIKRDLALARDSLSRNPVAELIDAGLMPTIVEDVAQEDDIYSYKSEFARRTEGALANVNPTLLSAAKQIYMAHDTKLYQGLSRITQLSDFVARYTLYQHVTNRKVNPLSKEDAIFEASETFINYDTPMHPTMQYLDDMGITMFTKYFLRIQRVLLKLAKENPARVFLTFGLDALMDLGPIVLEGSMFRKIGNNPFGPGALNYFGTLDELLTVSQTLSVFKTGSEWAP